MFAGRVDGKAFDIGAVSGEDHAVADVDPRRIGHDNILDFRVMAFNLLGDGLRDVLDLRLK
jgi:hypothetical protein